MPSIRASNMLTLQDIKNAIFSAEVELASAQNLIRIIELKSAISLLKDCAIELLEKNHA